MQTTEQDRANETEQLVPFTPKDLSEAELNARYCVQVFEEGISPAIEKITPSLIRAFSDFSRLSKGETIMGCKTQQEWAQRYFKRTARAVRYMVSTDKEKEDRKLVERDRQRRKRLAIPPPGQVIPLGDPVSLVPNTPKPLLLENVPDTSTQNPSKTEPMEMKVTLEFHNKKVFELKNRILVLEAQIDSLLRDVPERAFVCVEELRGRWDVLKSGRL